MPPKTVKSMSLQECLRLQVLARSQPPIKVEKGNEGEGTMNNGVLQTSTPEKRNQATTDKETTTTKRPRPRPTAKTSAAKSKAKDKEVVAASQESGAPTQEAVPLGDVATAPLVVLGRGKGSGKLKTTTLATQPQTGPPTANGAPTHPASETSDATKTAPTTDATGGAGTSEQAQSPQEVGTGGQQPTGAPEIIEMRPTPATTQQESSEPCPLSDEERTQILNAKTPGDIPVRLRNILYIKADRMR